MKSQNYLFYCLFAILLTACSSGDEDPQPASSGTVSGIVTSAVDQSTVANAPISIGGQTTNSASDGSFELTNVPTGTVWLRVEASAFDIYAEQIQVQEGQNNHNVQLQKSVYESDPFTMYLPPEIDKVNGVLFFLTGGEGDGRPWVRGDLTNDFEATASRDLIIEIMLAHGMAFIGNDNTHYSNQNSNEAMLSALEDFALASGRPELVQAPILPFGYSAGGGRSISFAITYPERTIGIYAYKPVTGNFQDQDWEKLRDIPTFVHFGELDSDVGGTIPEQFGPNREAGAIWAAGIEKGVGHEFDPPTEFMITWMEEMVISRIPDVVTPGTIPALNMITEQSGWIGDLNTFEISSHAEFQGDLGTTSWFLSEETALDWRTLFQ